MSSKSNQQQGAKLTTDQRKRITDLLKKIPIEKQLEGKMLQTNEEKIKILSDIKSNNENAKKVENKSDIKENLEEWLDNIL